MLLLFHLIICAAIGSTRGFKQRSLLYYRTFGNNRATATQPGAAQVIITTTHLFRGKMMENGGNRAKSESFTLACQVNDDAFGLSHTRKFSANIHKYPLFATF